MPAHPSLVSLDYADACEFIRYTSERFIKLNRAVCDFVYLYRREGYNETEGIDAHKTLCAEALRVLQARPLVHSVKVSAFHGKAVYTGIFEDKAVLKGEPLLRHYTFVRDEHGVKICY